MVLPGVLVLGMQTVIAAWNDLVWLLIVNSDITKLTLPVSISFMKGQYTSDIPSMMAASTMIVFPMIIVYILVQRKFQDSGVSSAIK